MSYSRNVKHAERVWQHEHRGVLMGRGYFSMNEFTAFAEVSGQVKLSWLA
jgi:hypothetical protein